MGAELNFLIRLFDSAKDFLYRWRRKLATVGVVLLICNVTYHVIFGANGLMIYSHKRAEYRSLQSEVDRLQKENQQLSKDIKALKTDPKTIEKEAREQLRYARPGEIIYTLSEKPAPPSAATAQNR